MTISPELAPRVGARTGVEIGAETGHGDVTNRRQEFEATRGNGEGQATVTAGRAA